MHESENPRFDQVVLRTARLLLRPLGEADAPALFAIHSDPQVMRYLSTPPWDSLEMAHTYIAKDLAEMREGDYLRLGIERMRDRQMIGTCTLFALVRPSRRAELGYCLASSAWGQGYMAEALRPLVGYAFNRLGLNRLEADIDPRNLGSERTLQRLGFRQEGLLRERWIVAGEVSDTAFYGLLRSDWNADSRARLW